jgi:hypothetical protein
LILYSVTLDSVLRIFIPILDSPEYLQLHASLDLFSALPFHVALTHAESHSSIFWLDRQTVGVVLDHILGESREAENRRIKEIKDEGWDLFLRVLGDGSIVVTAVAVCCSSPRYRRMLTSLIEHRPETSNTSSAIYPSAITTFCVLTHPFLPLPDTPP